MSPSAGHHEAAAVLPELTARRAVAECVTLDLMQLAADAF